MRNRFLVTAIFMLVGESAHAGEACRTAKDIVNLAQIFYGAEPDLKDIITPSVMMRLKGINGAANPTALLYRYKGEEHRLAILENMVVGLEKAADWSKDGEMCRMVDGALAPMTEGDSTRASVGFSFAYNRTDGLFPIEDLKEGAKDGSKIMKGLAPGGLGFVVPKLKAISLSPAEGMEQKPAYEFTQKGQTVTVNASPIGNTTLIRLKDIKASKADMLRISGAYRLEATFKFDPEDIATAEAKRLLEQTDSEN